MVDTHEKETRLALLVTKSNMAMTTERDSPREVLLKTGKRFEN